MLKFVCFSKTGIVLLVLQQNCEKMLLRFSLGSRTWCNFFISRSDTSGDVLISCVSHCDGCSRLFRHKWWLHNVIEGWAVSFPYGKTILRTRPITQDIVISFPDWKKGNTGTRPETIQLVVFFDPVKWLCRQRAGVIPLSKVGEWLPYVSANSNLSRWAVLILNLRWVSHCENYGVSKWFLSWKHIWKVSIEYPVKFLHGKHWIAVHISLLFWNTVF